uniref:Uncharacterized protein n=1 Tax=Cacopsylla melanoneura TaxID=428564 RepID=A0A8D8XZ06_9HEMI
MIRDTLDYFRGRIKGTPAKCGQESGLGEHVGQPKVSYFCVSVFIEQNVFQFQITMTNLMLMTVIDGGGYLSEYAPRFFFGENFLLIKKVVQLPPCRVLHDKHHFFSILKHFIDVDYVGMSDRRHDLNFPPDSDQISFGFYLAFLNGFDSHLLSGFFVDPQLHLAIVPLTKLPHYVKSLF